MKEKILIASKQAADTAELSVSPQGPYQQPLLPVTIWCWGLGAAETIDIQFPTDLAAPNNWATMTTLTDTIPHTAIYSPVKIRISKGITAGDVGVAMSPDPADLRGDV